MSTEAGTSYATTYDLDDDMPELYREYEAALAYANPALADELYDAREGLLEQNSTSWLKYPNGPEARAIFGTFPKEDMLSETGERKELAQCLAKDLAATAYSARTVAQYVGLDPDDHGMVVHSVKEADDYTAEALVNGDGTQFHNALDHIRQVQEILQRRIAEAAQQ